MPQVILDNAEVNFEFSRLRTVGELIEYIKTSIDPDAIILSLTKDDEPLNDSDWMMPLQAFNESRFDITTGSKNDFIKQRLEMVDDLIEELYLNFSEIIKLFKHGAEQEAHEPFSATLNDLNAFVGWLHSIYSVDEETFQLEASQYEKVIEDLKIACVDIQSYQIQQSWWNLGDVLDLKVLSILEQIKEINSRAIGKLLS